VKTEQFFARIPIPMTVSGNFHEIATFFDSLGRLRRIVNVSDIQLDNAKDVSGKVVVNGKFLVTTFMFLKPSDAKAPGKQN
jgi:type IV pilus assembly protein PilO